MAAKMTEDERRYLDQRFSEQDRRLESVESKVDAVLAALAKDREIMATRCATEAGRIDAIVERCDLLNEACDARHGSDRSRLGKLEANQRWIAVTVIGSLITGAVALLFEKAHAGK